MRGSTSRSMSDFDVASVHGGVHVAAGSIEFLRRYAVWGRLYNFIACSAEV